LSCHGCKSTNPLRRWLTDADSRPRLLLALSEPPLSLGCMMSASLSSWLSTQDSIGSS
jgi:hypothetical protein